jgi:hypothetical protein
MGTLSIETAATIYTNIERTQEAPIIFLTGGVLIQ